MRITSGIFLSQTKYAIEILERAHMLNCNPCRTPVDTDKKLGPEGSPLCLYMHDPREPHLNAMKRVLCYLRGTTDLGLQLFRSTTSQLIAYSDAGWVGCLATRRSTSGYCVFLGDNLLTWSSKRQDTLSRSSAEAEYRGVANAVAETSWIRNLLRELHTLLFIVTLVYYDNVSGVYMSANPVQHQRTKHLEIDIHFVRDKVAACHSTGSRGAKLLVPNFKSGATSAKWSLAPEMPWHRNSVGVVWHQNSGAIAFFFK
ncbi:ribonuclease H-like domain-containing protein [Tanacetum coccineum]|uniref:Ribonuclease H-like domain-containing protein n=1 Tax=Tanacetum coccineum TaxID=301880 RepID=A0ABQ4XFK8_9ASTR